MANRWRFVWLLRALFLLEFFSLTALLGLIGYANPDTFSSKLRQDGALNGFNSSPTSSVGDTPFVWTILLTKFNLALSVASFLVLVAQVALHILEIYVPVLAVVVNSALIGVWGYSIHGQSSSDYSDPKRPSPSPWFLRKSCDVVYYKSNKNYCYEAKATFGVSVLLVSIYAAFVVLAVFSFFTKKRHSGKEAAGSDSDNDSLELDGGRRSGADWVAV